MTKIHPETGAVLHRDVRPIEYTYKGESIIVDQPGWYPVDGDDGILTQEDMKVSDEALRIMKSRYESHHGENKFEIGDLSFA